VKSDSPLGGETRSRSKLVYQIAHAHAQSLGHTQKSVKTDPLFATFDLADVNRMKIGLFRERFLAHACAIAVLSNRVAKGFEMFFRARHNCLREQEAEHRNTPNMGLFGFSLRRAYGHNKRRHE
jgi:hypothetical protein